MIKLPATINMKRKTVNYFSFVVWFAFPHNCITNQDRLCMEIDNDHRLGMLRQNYTKCLLHSLKIRRNLKASICLCLDILDAHTRRGLGKRQSTTLPVDLKYTHVCNDSADALGSRQRQLAFLNNLA